MVDNFGEVEVGEIDAIQVTVDYFIYNLFGIKEPNNVVSMVDTGG